MATFRLARLNCHNIWLVLAPNPDFLAPVLRLENGQPEHTHQRDEDSKHAEGDDYLLLVGLGGIELLIYVVEEINLGSIAGEALLEGFAGVAQGLRRVASGFYTDIAERKHVIIV